MAPNFGEGTRKGVAWEKINEGEREKIDFQLQFFRQNFHAHAALQHFPECELFSLNWFVS